MIERGTKQHQLIHLCDDVAHVFCDRLGPFDTVLELLLELFDMSTRWVTICAYKSLLDFPCSGCSCNKRLHSKGNSANNGAVEHHVLGQPRGMRWIWLK